MKNEILKALVIILIAAAALAGALVSTALVRYECNTLIANQQEQYDNLEALVVSQQQQINFYTLRIDKIFKAYMDQKVLSEQKKFNKNTHH